MNPETKNLQDLNEIIHPIVEDLQKVKDAFEELLHSPVKVINLIAGHLVRQRGKGLRPILVILSARICKDPTPETYNAAALIEMLHNATLIHDDVVDDSTVRRGGPALHTIWKNRISVLIGDYILARSLTTAVKLKNLEAIEILSESSARMSQGEISQLMNSRKKDITKEEYFQVIGDKTAALISACCQLGAISVSASHDKVEILKRFGEKIGLAFQIKDDLLDIEGEERLIGKRRGADLKNGKVTLPLIYALEQVNNSLRSKILKKVKKKARRTDVKFIIQFIRENGGFEYATKTAEEYIEEAQEELCNFPESEYKTALLNLTKYIVQRKR